MVHAARRAHQSRTGEGGQTRRQRQLDARRTLPARPGLRPGECQHSYVPADPSGALGARFALGTDAAVVLVDYTSVPEAAYPVAVEQCYAVATWLCKRGEEIGLDGSRIAAVGDSTGGNLEAALTLLAKERGGIRLVQQVLLYSVTDADFGTSSYREFAEGYFVGRDTMRRFWDRCVPDVQQRSLATVSPLPATLEQLAGIPPALVVTSEADVARNEGEAYSARLRAAGFMVLDQLRETESACAALIQTFDNVHVALYTRRDQPR
ncbi:alpha/beta hydrolase [Streptomyces sp. NPDC002540]